MAQSDCKTLTGKQKESFEYDQCEGYYRKTRDVAGPQRPSGPMAFNYIVDHLLTGISWDEVRMTTNPNTNNFELMNFYYEGSIVKQIFIECVQDGAEIRTQIADPSFLLLENDDFLLTEDDCKIIL